MGTLGRLLPLLSALCGSVLGLTSTAVYYGAEIGKLNTNYHEVRGVVYATNEKTLFIKSFNYDGKGIGGVVFWAGTGDRPDNAGFHIPSDRDSNGNLPAIENEDIILHLPEGIKVTDINWLSIWTKNYSTSFGAVRIPESLVPPQPLLVGPLNTTKGVHSGEILILDSQTFVIPDFSYDGSGKDVHWWLSRGNKPNMEGIRVGEDDSDLPLQEQLNRTVVIPLPDGQSVFEYDFLSLWSVSENNDYGFVNIPEVLNVPPSPRTLRFNEKSESDTNKMNCEMLNDNLGLEVRWLISGNNIIIHLVGNLEESEYMALGLSKDDTETKFDSADAAVTWLDGNGIGHVVDYFFENTERCENGHGMCPDEIHKNSRNNLQLLSAIKSENTTIITFKRPLKAEEQSYDQNIYTDGPQAVLWAVGPVQGGVFIGPPKLRTRGNLLLDFGRDPNWNCPPPSNITKVSSIEKHDFVIRCPSDHLFRAQMGPDNNGRNVWFINGLPTPKLTVKRGTEYTFIVEGGMNPSNRNPLYITSSKEGGFNQNFLMVNDTSEEFFAGVHHDIASGIYLPTSEGRLCQWSFSVSDPERSVSTIFSNSTEILTLACEPGSYAKLSWTPNPGTPSTVYYQSFTEKGIGGIIQVVDSCEEINSRTYLESGLQESEDKSKSNADNSKSEIEREGSLEQVSNSIKTKIHRESEKIQSKPEREDIEDSVLYEKDAFENSDKSLPFIKIENQPIDYSETSNNFDKKAFEIVIHNNHSSEIYDDSLMMDEPPRTEISQPLAIDPLHPHDESERSDKNMPHSQNTEKNERVQQNKVPVGAHSVLEKSSSTRQHTPVLHSKNEPHQIRRVPSRFKPQFEGGFIPLVLNPIKEKESSLSHNFDLPPSHLRRPHRPFLFNESIPFHGTFKPGVPDFSGFNISHYSQEDSYPLNHVLDNLSLVSSSTPQLIQRPLNGLPPELFQRHQVGMPRPQIFGYGHRPKMSDMGYYQQPAVFAQLPNIRVPNSHEELSEVSSQRVQVALQASVEDKGKSRGLPNLQIMRSQDRKHKDKQHSNKLVHAPPIQRRPDFVEGEMQLNSSPYKQTPLNYFPERLPANLNKNEKPRVPPARQTGGLQTPYGIRRPAPGIDNGPRRIPPHGLKGPNNHFIQNPHREILSHFPFKQAESTHMQKVQTPNTSSNNKHIHPSLINPKTKSVENPLNKDGKPSEDFDPATQGNNQERFPLLLNPELMQHPPKHATRPQLFAIRPTGMNIPGLFFQGNRPHGPPSFLSNGEVKVKKIPIPLQEPRLKNIPSPLEIAPMPSKLSLNDKADHNQNPITKLNDTAKVSENSQYQSTNEKEMENDAGHEDNVAEKFEIHPSEFQGTPSDTSENGARNDPTFQYENEKLDTVNSENTFTTISDYEDYDVPFGARLKIPPKDESERPRPNLHNRKRLSPFPRKPQLTSSSPIEENTERPDSFSLYTQLDNQGTNFEDVSHPKADSSNLEHVYEKDDELSEMGTSKSPTSLIPKTDENIKSLNNSHFSHIDSTNDKQRYETLFADTTLEKHHGRKHILPNSSGNSSELLNIPPRVPQNLTLPHISEKPPIHDNGTDYSILNHVLSLIGGQPDPNISPRHPE